MTELKPCPFCGGRTLLQFDYPFRRRPGVRGCYVKCETCGGCTGNYETIEDAQEAWNMRKDSKDE